MSAEENNKDEGTQCSLKKPCFWAKILPYLGAFFLIMLIIGFLGGC